MNVKEEFKNHLLFEFFHRDELIPLMEERGYSPEIDIFVMNFLEFVKIQINESFSHGPSLKTYTRQDCDGVFDGTSNLFFDNFIISLLFEPSERNSYKGGFKATGSFYNDGEGKLVCQPNIEIKVWGKDEINMARILCFCVGHELTHAYNTYCYLKGNGIHSSDASSMFDKQNYGPIKMEMIFGNREIGYMAYLLNRAERNAYISQLRQELMGLKDEITDSKSAYEAIKKTESYQIVFLSLLDSIKKLNAIPDDSIKAKEILSSLGRVSRKFKNLRQAKKFFNAQWEKWKKKYMAMASKIAFDVFSTGRITTANPKR